MKNKILFTFVVVLTIFWNAKLISQDENNIKLLYQKKWDKLLNLERKDSQRWQEFEIFARMYSRYANLEEKTLPIVFNVLDDGAKKINVEILKEQINILNIAFSGGFKNNTNRDYSNVICQDSKLRFCFGQPSESSESGIRFKQINNNFEISDFEKVVNNITGLQSEDDERYINIWILEMPDDMRGFAVMPGQNNLFDGIFIDPDFVGNRPESQYYSEGKTLVHLVGKYLGLHALWTDNECSDDGVEDTPIHNAPNYRCFDYSHISTCSGNSEEMIGNFMDATPDACTFMFTKAQVARMHAILTENGYGKNLLEGVTNCNLTELDENNVISRSINTNLDFTIIPNPGSAEVQINIQNQDDKGEMQIQIIDVFGSIVYQSIIHPSGKNINNLKIDISKFCSGSTYFVKLIANGEFVSKKLVKI